MARLVRVGGAQLGPIQPEDTRAQAVDRMIALLRQAAGHGCNLVVFPELALTTFFPRRIMQDPDEANVYCETTMPTPETKPLFDEAARLGIGFYLGYAELAEEAGRKLRYNTAILVNGEGQIVGKYRKVHLPGRAEPDPTGVTKNYEQRYFTPGNLGFPVFKAFGGVMGMALCNDRRWPETYRVMALQGVEMVMLGYNTGAVRWAAEGNRIVQMPSHLEMFHNHLSMQAGAYQNSTWVIGVAKAGCEDGEELMGGSCIIAPSGEIVALARTLGDELIVADCDLDAVKWGRETYFRFDVNRRIEHYGLIASQRGVIPPE